MDQPIETMRKVPRQRRAWQTITAIFEATAQILGRDGEGGLNTNRVAERAGVSIGTLYQYFPDMDSVILTMIGLEQRRVVRELDGILAGAETDGGDPAVHLRRFVRHLILSFGTAPPGGRALLRRAWLMDHTPEVIAMTRDTAARIHTALERRAHPSFPTPDPAVLFVVTRAVLGAIRAAVLEDSPLPGTPAFEDALVALAASLLGPVRG